MREALYWAAFLLGLATTLPAAAATPNITELLTLDSRLFYRQAGAGGGTIFDGNNTDVGFSNGFSRLGVQLNSTLGLNGSFFFLHNIYVQGHGEISMVTTLEIAITNNEPDAVYLRLDSLITPGFIGFQGSNPGPYSAVDFGFAVNQFDENGFAFQLYRADGRLTSSTLQPNLITTSDNRPFTGFSEYSAPGRLAYEWGATPLSVYVEPIPSGQTHILRYSTSTSVKIQNGLCETLLGCEGVQVAFGDPRNDGSVEPFSASFGSAASFNAPVSNNQLLIGRRFNATTYSSANIVDSSTPFPDPDALPPPAPPATFDWLPQVDGLAVAVPEPSSWLMLITGFGLVGATLRRRRAALA